MDVTFIDKYEKRLKNIELVRINGKVSKVVGLVIESIGPDVQIGDLCEIRYRHSNDVLKAEVVGFKGNTVLLMPLGDVSHIGPGCDVIATGKKLGVRVGFNMLGRVFDGLGNPIDGKGSFTPEAYYPLTATPPHPLKRKRITQPLSVGIKAVDALITIGKGQRVGILAGSGVGKSTLLGMMARYTTAEVNVIALVGERGREVREFIERDLGEGIKKSVIVVATSDQPPLVRLKASLTATAIAEFFRDQGMDVLLMMDSITRVAMAQRDVGLAIGEPPATRGYTPSVFAFLPKLLERAGNSEKGSITGIYTVLVEGDDMNEPVADTARSILDGHIILSRKLASSNHYPAIDVLHSVSRVMTDIVTKEHLEAAARIRELLATYTEAEDLINIGAYEPGSNAQIDIAIEMIDKIKDFLRQGINESSSFEESVNRLIELASLSMR